MAVDDIDMLQGDKKIPAGQMYKRIFKYIKPELGFITIALLLSFLNVLFDVISPKFMAGIIDEISGNERAFAFLSSFSSIKYVITLAVSSFVLTLLGQGFLLLETWILNKSGQRIVYQLRMQVFEHIQNMSQDQLNEMPVGSLVTRVANYTSSLSELFTNILINALKNIITIVGVFIIMSTISIQLSLIMLIFLVVVFGISFVFRGIVRKIFTKERIHSLTRTFLV